MIVKREGADSLSIVHSRVSRYVRVVELLVLAFYIPTYSHINTNSDIYIT